MTDDKKPDDRRASIHKKTESILDRLTAPRYPSPPAGEPAQPAPAAGQQAAGEKAGEDRPPRRRKKQPLTDSEKMARRLPHRATYEIGEPLKDEIAALADDLGCSQSQLAALLLLVGLDQVNAGNVDPAALRELSRSPRFEYNLDLTDWLKKILG